VTTVGEGFDGVYEGAAGRAEFDAQHRQGFLAMLEADFAQEDAAKLPYVKAVPAAALDTRTLEVDFLHDGAQQHPMGFQTSRRRRGQKSGVRILRHFAQIAIFCKLIPYGSKGLEIQQEFVVKDHVHFAASDLQILELAADQAEGGFFRAGYVAGGDASDDAVGGNHIQDIETFNRGSDLRGVDDPVFTGFVFNEPLAAHDVRVPGFKEDGVIDAEIIHARIAKAAGGWKVGRRLHFNDALERAKELAAERVGAGMVVESAAWSRVCWHGGHLSK
jgi:hypothetical protein